MFKSSKKEKNKLLIKFIKEIKRKTKKTYQIHLKYLKRPEYHLPKKKGMLLNILQVKENIKKNLPKTLYLNLNYPNTT